MKKLRHFLRRRDVVVSSLAGGLGNQMFEYAAGLALSQQTGCRLVLDRSMLHDPGLETVRPYGLDAFRIQCEIDTLSRFALRNCIRLVEANAEYHPGLIESAQPGTRLIGYWQSEKYFLRLRPHLLQQFQLSRPPADYPRTVAQLISEAPGAICLHVRRGDYVSNPNAAQYHGLCSIVYYLDSLAELRSSAQTGRLFLFSDDPEWVRQNFPLETDTYLVDSSRSSAAEDIWLMSLCTHHVVANSSFSWWGAWLSVRGGRKFAPARWFKEPLMNDRDLVPAGWVRR